MNTSQCTDIGGSPHFPRLALSFVGFVEDLKANPAAAAECRRQCEDRGLTQLLPVIQAACDAAADKIVPRAEREAPAGTSETPLTPAERKAEVEGAQAAEKKRKRSAAAKKGAATKRAA